MEHHKEQAEWEFVFLGANIDAIETAKHFGIGADRAQSYHADEAGVALNFAVMSESVAEFRRTGKMDDRWKEKIEQDYKGRGGKH